MRFGFVGQSYTPYSISADSQRTVNLYPEKDETGQGKNDFILIGTPGLSTLLTLTNGLEVKTLFYETVTKRIFAVVNVTGGSSRLIEIFLNGNQTDRGPLVSAGATKEPASISTNGTQLFIVEGGNSKAFIFTLSGNSLQDVSSIVAEGSPKWGRFIDGYFHALGASGKIYLSALYNGTSWDPLDFQTPESSPDTGRILLSDHGELVIFGDESIEFWANSGKKDFPFTRIPGTTIPQGILYKYSAAAIGNQFFWVGRGVDGGAIIYTTEAYQPKRISTHAMERLIGDIGTITGAPPVAWTYQEQGHAFYALTFPENNLTVVYDLATGMWHERMFLNGSTEEAHRVRCTIFAGGEEGAAAQVLGGDRANGKVYKMSLPFFDDAGSPIRRIRRARHLSEEMKRSFYQDLKLDVEQGVGEGVYAMRWSDNGGKLFGSQLSVIANGPANPSEASAVSISGAGTGYVVGDVLTVSGGTGTAATLRVDTVAAGAITGISVRTGGRYTVNPANPVSVTGGTGTGATFSLTMTAFNADINPRWRRLGSGRDRVFEIQSDSSIKQVWLDAYLRFAPGAN